MKLKPCPFCGAFPAIYENRSEAVFTVECVNQMCRLQVKSYKCETEEAVIELWNTRAEKTAHWDINTDGFYLFCSHCGEAAQHMTPHCPNCGAKMITRRKEP